MPVNSRWGVTALTGPEISLMFSETVKKMMRRKNGDIYLSVDMKEPNETVAINICTSTSCSCVWDAEPFYSLWSVEQLSPCNAVRELMLFCYIFYCDIFNRNRYGSVCIAF